MTDTQERVEINQIPTGQRFGFLRRLVNRCIASEWSFYKTIAAVVVVGAALYHYHAINSLEACLETTVKKMLDKREQGSKAFINEAIKESETNVLERLLGDIKSLETTKEKMLDKREQDSKAFINEAIKESETNMLKRLLDVKSLETTMEKMLDEREQGSRAFIDEARKTLQGNVYFNMAREFDELRTLLVRKNCAELFKFGKTISGVYKINPDGAEPDLEVFCDQETAGGGWTVVQRRLDGSVDFDRNWFDYKHGFGNLGGEFWLGLEKIQRLTKSQSKLRVDLEDFDGNAAYADYNMFSVANESKKYQLSVGTYSGTAGDSFTHHHDCPFTTKDQDNDSYEGNCAKNYKGAWWYRNCHHSNLNGDYHHWKHSSFGEGVNWHSWQGYYYSVRRAEMKIRPVEF